MLRLTRLLIVICLLAVTALAETRSPENQVFQFMQHGTLEYAPGDEVKTTAHLWIPETCGHLRGLLVLGENVTEHGIVGHPAIRAACAAGDLGIVWCSPRFMSVKTLDDSAKHVAFLQQLLDGLAATSGYDEVASVPWLPMGESMHLRMVYHLLNAAPQRCIAGICIKNAVSLSLCRNRETPLLVAVGTAQEWFQNEKDIRTKWQDLAFYDTLLRERQKHPTWPMSLLVEGGSGHFDCTEAMARHFAGYITAVTNARLPAEPEAPLRAVTIDAGVEAGLPLPDAAATETKTHTKPWYLDEALARDAQRMAAINWKASSQLPTFLDVAGIPVPMLHQGITKPVPLVTGEDGITFEVRGGLLPEIPAGFVGVGEPLAMAPGTPVVEWLAGPVAPVESGRFRIALDRTWPQGPVCVTLRHRGTAEIRDVVQPGYLELVPNSEGAAQEIDFEPVADQIAGIQSVPLIARAGSGMKVRFYVVAGPAKVEGDALHFTPVPPRTRFPVEITVTAWQWGRSIEPRVQTAKPVTRTFRLLASKPVDELAQVIADAGMKNRLRLDLQRPIDPRLAKLEAGDFLQSSLFRGKTYLARSAAEVGRLSGKLAPGDQLVLASGEWKDARFTLEGYGTMDAPILIRPEKPGSVVFTGESTVRFHGKHLIVHDLAFRGVHSTKNSTVIFAVGNGEAKPANHCLFHQLRFENCGSTNPEERTKLHLWLMSLRGRGNTVADCTFRGLQNIGQMLGAAELPLDGPQQLHVLNNHFIDRPHLDDQNGYEVLQIGWSGVRAAPTGSLIQGNTFERCDGENELITLKASDVVVRGNRFIASQGVLCLRTSRRVLVQDNVFDGQGRENTGGVRLQGDGHVLIGNTFRNLRKPKDYYNWPVSLMASDLEIFGETDQLGGYGRARDILITRNRFDHCDKRIAAGIYARKDYPLLPRNIVVRDNNFTGMGEGSVFDFIAADPAGEMRKELREERNVFRPWPAGCDE
ncbi:MAG: polysaccharide lyase 6 family protein [Verrucomicrobiaceae bacterium]|nr:polysaccharide lyase 6 family protein [Verrucomicrobiaceae bacterium]